MELTRSFSAEQFARALESWDWADIQGKQPLFTSPFGDVFFQAQDGFWFLDLLEGTLTRPWPDAGALQAELNTGEGQDRYLMAGLAFAAERQSRVPWRTARCRTLAGRLPDACRTHWNRDFTASERTGSGVSWRSGWPGAPGCAATKVVPHRMRRPGPDGPGRRLLSFDESGCRGTSTSTDDRSAERGRP